VRHTLQEAVDVEEAHPYAHRLKTVHVLSL
jgi:hypothetical protein